MAKAPKTSASAVASNMSNGPDPELVSGFVRKILDVDHEIAQLKIPYDSEIARRRTLLKNAKAAGIDVDDLKWVVRQKTRDPRDVEREDTRRRWYAQIMGLPVGTQLGLFEVPQQVLDDNALHDATRAGLHVGKQGGNRHDNPHPPASELFVRWDRGYMQGQETITESMARTGAAPAAEGLRGEGPESGAAAPVVETTWAMKVLDLTSHKDQRGMGKYSAFLREAETDGGFLANFEWSTGRNADGQYFTAQQIAQPHETARTARISAIAMFRKSLSNFIDTAGPDVTKREIQAATAWIEELGDIKPDLPAVEIETLQARQPGEDQAERIAELTI